MTPNIKKTQKISRVPTREAVSTGWNDHKSAPVHKTFNLLNRFKWSQNVQKKLEAWNVGTEAPSHVKHVLHCILMVGFMISSVIIFVNVEDYQLSPVWNSGTWPRVCLYVPLVLSVLVALPYEILIFIGLFFYDTFPRQVKLNYENTDEYPFICFRVTTKGVAHNLVRSTVSRNFNLIKAKGLKNFKLQVLTNNFIPAILKHPKIQQMVVPQNYETKTGALYKARNLQYALENDTLEDRDWIVHLDEETLLTSNSLTGILNFIHDGGHQFGQGMVTYSNDFMVNWITTLADTNRVADDLGKIRAQFKLFHAPLFSMKGPYTVAQVGAERSVGFDNGPNGSIAEDCFFVMKAYEMGFTFDFIQGEMWEFSPFSLWDFVQQRKRWFQGILLVISSRSMTFTTMFWLIIDFQNRFFQPLPFIYLVFNLYKFVLLPFWFETPALAFYGLRIYMYVFGILKTAHCSSRAEQKRPLKLFGLSVLAVLIVRPIHMAMDILAMLLGIFQWKYGFYLVKKEV